MTCQQGVRTPHTPILLPMPCSLEIDLAPLSILRVVFVLPFVDNLTVFDVSGGVFHVPLRISPRVAISLVLFYLADVFAFTD